MRSGGHNGHHVPPERIGAGAYRYLNGRVRSGIVVSRFSGGINLLFENGEAFIPIQTSAVPLHSWAVEIPGEALRFAEGTPVSVERGELSIGNTHIPFSNAQVEELSLSRFSAEEAAIAQRVLPLLKRFVEEVRRTHPPDPFQPEIDAIIERWLKSEDPEVLLDLIGLGAGSTPTGDDVLLGTITGMSLFEGTDNRVKGALSRLRAGIQETARLRTPLPSAQMLLAACDRSFPEPLLSLLEGLAFRSPEGDLLEMAARVGRLGHHSGLAILSGLTNCTNARVMLDRKTSHIE